MEKKKLTPSAEVLQKLFEDGQSPLSDQFLRWKLWQSWPQVVGKLADRCRPVGYYQGTLVVWAANSSWLQQLLFFRDTIRERVNKHVGAPWVERVHLTLDSRHVPNQSDCDPEFMKFLQKISPRKRSGGVTKS